MRQIDYKVVTGANASALTTAVNAEIANMASGYWQPVGDPTYNGTGFTQAMVKLSARGDRFVEEYAVYASISESVARAFIQNDKLTLVHRSISDTTDETFIYCFHKYRKEGY